MATYLVTGCAGFIGARVCQLLLAEGHCVVGIDNLNSYYNVRLKDYRLGALLDGDLWRKAKETEGSVYWLDFHEYPLRSKNDKFNFYYCDIENIGDLKVVFERHKFDAVLNLAARAGVRFSMENPHVYLSTNAHGTLNLLECQRMFSVSRMVLASTSSLYAGCPMPWNEQLAVNTPLSAYAASKKAAEMLAYSYHKLYGIKVSVLRYFTVYGPAGRPDMSIYRFIKRIDEGEVVDLYGDGKQVRDFTYVDDIANGTVSALCLPEFETINLGGGGPPVCLSTVISILESIIGKKAEINYQPYHKADMIGTWANIERARSVMKWWPVIGLEEGLQRSVNWYRENRDWLSLV